MPIKRHIAALSPTAGFLSRTTRSPIRSPSRDSEEGFGHAASSVALVFRFYYEFALLREPKVEAFGELVSLLGLETGMATFCQYYNGNMLWKGIFAGHNEYARTITDAGTICTWNPEQMGYRESDRYGSCIIPLNPFRNKPPAPHRPGRGTHIGY